MNFNIRPKNFKLKKLQRLDSQTFPQLAFRQSGKLDKIETIASIVASVLQKLNDTDDLFKKQNPTKKRNASNHKPQQSDIIISNKKNRAQVSYQQQYWQRMDPRDKIILVPFHFKIPYSDNQDFSEGNILNTRLFVSIFQKLQDFLVKVLELVMSISFNQLMDGKMKENQCKDYASKNILLNVHSICKETYHSLKQRNIIDGYERNVELALVQISDNTLTKAVKNLSPYYPQAPPVGGSPRIRQALLAIDRNYNSELDFLSTQKLILEKNPEGDYTEYIMRVINRAILVTGEIQEGESRNLTLFQKFKDFTQNLIWLVKNESFSKIISTVIDSNKKNSQILSSTQNIAIDKDVISDKKHQIYEFLKDTSTINRVQALKFQYEKIAITEETVQKQILAIKQNREFELGQKLPNGLKPFSKNQIKDHNFSAKHSSVLRILTKWAENLEAIFQNAEKFVLNRNYPFQTLSGKSIYPEKSLKQKIYKQLVGLKHKKNKILIDLIASNKTFQASFLSKRIEQNQQILEYIKRYTDTRIMASKMNTLVIKFMQKYVSQLINLLIEAGKIQQTTQNSKNKSEIQYINLVSFRIGDLMRARMYLNQASCIKLLHTLYMLDEQESKDSPFFKLVRVKNKLDKKDNNILINFLFNGQLQCQLQLFSQKLQGKQKKYYEFSHFLYELSRGSFGILSECAIIISQHDPIASSPSYYEAQLFLNKQNITDLSATKNHLEGEQKSIFICVKCNKLIMNENKQIFLKQKQNENVCNECFIKHFKKINSNPQQSDTQSSKKLTIQNFLSNQHLSQWINQLIDNVQIKKLNNYGEFSQIKQFCLFFSINPKYNQVDYNILIYEQTQFQWYLIRINDQILKAEQIRDEDMDIKIISQYIGQQRQFKELNYIQVTQNRINISDLILFNKKIPNYINMVNKLYQIEEKARAIIAKNSIMSMLRNKNQTLAFNKNGIKMEIMSELFSAESNINFIEYIFAEELQLKKVPQWIGQAKKAKLINLSSNSISDAKPIQSKYQLKQLYLSNNQIEQISCQRLTKLQKLHLKQNRLSTFVSNQLTFLTELNLQGNKISEIQLLNFSSLVSLNLSENNFSSLNTSCLSINLQKLNISSNQLDSSVLINLPPNLKELTVNSNHITELPFGCLPLNIMTLNISSNRLTELIIVGRPFLSYLNANCNSQLSQVQIKQLPSLSEIQMQSCALQSLDKIQFSPKASWMHFHNNRISKVTLKNLECVKSLDFTGNNLTKLELKDVDIRLLSLLNNSISSLEGFDFPKTLEKIFLKDNILTSASFKNFPNLELLNLQSNCLTSLDLLDLPVLKQLALDFNSLNSIQSINLPSSIQSLFLRKNNIQSVSLSDMSNLRLIVFDQNPLTKISLKSMPKLQEVGLMYTKITSNEDIEVPRTVKKIYLHYNELNSVEYRNMPNLQLVVLQGNKIADAVFDNLPNLKEFYLNENEVASLTLKKLPKLQKLVAPSNLLMEVKLTSLPFLKQLHVQHNQITSIDLGQAPLIQSVDLSFNQIKEIKVKNLPALFKLEVTYNKIEVCELQNLPSLVTLNLAENLIKQCSVRKLKSLKELKLYGNPMEKIELAELKRLTTLQISEIKIKTLTIQVLPSLKTVTIISSELQTLFFYNTPELQQLSLYENKLTHVNFNQIEKLKYVNANTNLFTALSFCNLAYLQTLNICQNQIQYLSLASLPKLNSISFRTNQLQSVDFNHLPNIQIIDLTANNFKEIDLSHLKGLSNLTIGNNPITKFDNIRLNKEGIKTIDISQTLVEEITIKDYTKLNSFLSPTCKHLKSLSIYDCALLNDITLTQCELLKVLELVRTPNLNLMNLQTLSITTIKLQNIGSECMIYVDNAQLQKMIKDILPEVGVYNSSPQANYRSYQQPPY